jgi:hypothetical protein
MATEAQINANRANAQHSTGPRTDTGKANSSQNARRHGLTSWTILPSEQQEFDDLYNSMRALINPVGAIEHQLLHDLVRARWGMCRVSRLEEQLAEQSPTLDPLANPETRATAELYMRYFQRFEASYHRILKQLRAVQTNRVSLELLPIQPLPPDTPFLADAQKLHRFAKRTQSPAPPIGNLDTELAYLTQLLRPPKGTHPQPRPHPHPKQAKL